MVRVAFDAMGGDHGPTEVVPGVIDYARAHPDVELILVGDTDTVRRIAGRYPTTSASSTPGSVIEMDEHPALAMREKKDASILVAAELVRKATPTPSLPPATRAPAWPRASSSSARLPGVDRPGLAVQMVTDHGPLVLIDIGANPDSTAENLAQYARMGSIFSEKVLGVADPRVALLSIGEEKGKGDARIQRATELLDASTLHLRGQRRGPRSDPVPGRRRGDRRGRGQRRDQVLRGPVGLHLRPVAERVPPGVAWSPGVPADAPEHRAHPEHLRLRDARRLAVARREGHGHHHARQCPSTDDRVRVRRCRPDGRRPRPGPDRRGAGSRQRAAGRVPPGR